MYLIKRIGTALITIVAISIFLFLMLQVIPADPVLSNLSSETIEQNPRLAEAMKKEFELDKPVHTRYLNWASRVVLDFDFGKSFSYSNYSVLDLMKSRIKPTIILTLLSLAIIVFFGLILGLILAILEDRLIGKFLNIVAQIGLALPNFWVAILLLGFFGAVLGWFPIKSRVFDDNLIKTLHNFALPAITLSIGGIASVARYLKSSLIEEKQKQYVIVAKSKGLQNVQVMLRHVFKNSLIPVSTIIGLMFISLITGSIVVENVFSIAGLGSLLIKSISTGDYPLIQAIVLYYSVVVVLVSFALDVVYAIIDPRIRSKS